jgi:RimJ/RimL family protein N-acetyltransferase
VRTVGSTVDVTPRLVLEGWTDADVEALARIGTAEVVRYLGGAAWTTATALESIELWRQIQERLGITTWAVRLRETDELIGTCGFAGTNVTWLRFEFVIEIGWTFGRAWWGRGFATEAAQAALRVGLARYPAERIIAKCHIDNTASERVMHRIGMHRVGVVRGDFAAPTIVCRLT